MIELKNNGLKLVLSEPGTYYRGVRFDRGGVFRSIEKGDYSYADEWFRNYDPYMHDAVCGCSEEFVCADYEAVRPGETICKIGVGMLVRPDAEPYSIRNSYPLADAGKWEWFTDGDKPCKKATFRHLLKSCYEYEKTIEILSGDCFEIRHRLLWTGENPWKGWSYNHNFFTFGGTVCNGQDTEASNHGYTGTIVGPGRKIRFPFKPEGDWRSVYHCVALDGNGISFNAPVEPPSVFMGNLHAAGSLTEGQGANADRTPFNMSIAEGERKVLIEGFIGKEPATVDKIVFWSNPDVACLEPYLPLSLTKGECLEWTLRYTL